MQTSDVIIIIGGILGLATAYNLSEQDPSKKFIVLEKEDHLAAVINAPLSGGDRFTRQLF